MTKSLMFCVVSCVGLITWAQPNPLIRICNITGGVFHAIQVESDEVGFCEYGTALMDSLSLLEATSADYRSAAVEALEDSFAKNCDEALGEDLQGQDLEGRAFDLCVFGDGSMIELETLKAGAGADSNSALLQALQLKF